MRTTSSQFQALLTKGRNLRGDPPPPPPPPPPPSPLSDSDGPIPPPGLAPCPDTLLHCCCCAGGRNTHRFADDVAPVDDADTLPVMEVVAAATAMTGRKREGICIPVCGDVDEQLDGEDDGEGEVQAIEDLLRE